MRAARAGLSLSLMLFFVVVLRSVIARVHVPLRHYLNAAEQKGDENSRRGPANRGEPRKNHAHDISFVKMKKVQLNELAKQIRQHRRDSLAGNPGSPELSSDRGINDDDAGRA